MALVQPYISYKRVTLTDVVAEDGVGVVDGQLWVVEPCSHLFTHVHKRSVMRRKERVLAAGALQSQLIPRRCAFHKLPDLQRNAADASVIGQKSD